MSSRPPERRARPLAMVAALAATATLAGCVAGPLDPSELPGTPAVWNGPIVGGTPVNGGWDSVVYLSVGGGVCTGTVIAPDVVLTAAHCLEGVYGPVHVLWSDDANQSYWASDSSTDYHMHPQYDPWTSAADIAVVVLPHTSPSAPVPFNTDSPSNSWLGQANPLRFVGFGVTHHNAWDDGTKRQVDIAVDSWDADFLYYHDNQHQTCFGDSGGPAMTAHDGGWKVAGVTSWGDQTCSQMGANTRTDVHTAWIQGFTGGGGPPDGDDADGDGWTAGGGDCDDDDPGVHPGATEHPDHVDEDCDGLVDEDTDYYDDDGDGHTEADGDCDDDAPDVYPGAPEHGDGVDNDCDGQVDEGGGPPGDDDDTGDDDDSGPPGDDDDSGPPADDDDDSGPPGDDDDSRPPGPPGPDHDRPLGTYACHCDTAPAAADPAAALVALLLAGWRSCRGRSRRADG